MSDQNDMNPDDYVENTTLGEVEGELIQTGNIGEGAPESRVRNTQSGEVSGTVIQAGDISGSIHL